MRRSGSWNRGKSTDRPMRVDLKTAIKRPHMFKLYVKEWYARRRCEGFQAGGVGLVSGGIVYLMLNAPDFLATLSPLIVWAMIAVPVVFLGYGIIALCFPFILFRLTHGKTDIETAMGAKKKGTGQT